MADFRIRVIVDPSGANRGTQQVERGLNRVENRADALRRTLRNVFAGLATGVAVRGLIELSDTLNNVRNRLRTVTTGNVQLNLVQSELFDIARRTRAEFEATAEVYTRVALASRDLGISQQETLEFTESLNQAVILSGASAQEAQAGLIQLSQGLASGALRGDELRSVLEQLPVVADVIAESLGVTRGELRELGAEGAITADIVLRAFREASDDLNERFGQTVPTIGQSITNLRTEVLRLFNDFGVAGGITNVLVGALQFLTDNLEFVARVAASAGVALGTAFAARGVVVAITALRSLAVVIALNPFGALVIGIGAALSALVAFSDQVRLTANGSATAFDFIVVAFEEFVSLAETGLNFVSGLLGDLEVDFGTFDLADFLRNFSAGLDGALALAIAIFAAITRFVQQALATIANAVVDTFQGAVSIAENFVTGLNVLGRRITFQELDPTVVADFGINLQRVEVPAESVAETFSRVRQDIQDTGIFLGFTNRTLDGANERAEERTRRERETTAEIERQRQLLGQATGPGIDAGAQIEGLDERNAILEREIQLLEQEAQALALVGDERAVLTGRLAIEEQLRNTLREANENLSEEQINSLARLTDAEAARLELVTRAVSEAQRRSDVEEEFNGVLREQEQRLAAAQSLFDAREISQRQFNEVLREGLLAQREFNIQATGGTFADGFIANLLRMTEGARSFSAEVGGLFANTFDSLGRGFADTIGQGIFDVNNLGEAFRSLARDAVSQFISSLIQIGIQQAANFALGQALQSAATTSAVAQQATIAAAAPPAAAATSLATAGANAAPASLGITTIFALLAGLVGGAALAGFRDGTDFVGGAGSSLSDSVFARLSVGEGVVNARANRMNRGAVGFMNNGGQVEPAGASRRPVVVNFNLSGDVDSFRRNRRQIVRETQQALETV